MGNAFQGREVLSALVPAVQDAWGLSRVALRQPRTRQLDLPYAVIWFDAFGADFGGVQSVLQSLRFGILGRFPFPTDSSLNVELEKLDRVNEVIAVLQTGPTFGGAMLPLVTRADFGETDSPTNAAYEVTVFFEVTMTADHH